MKAKLQSDAFGRAVAQVPSCALDEQGLEGQRERRRRLAPAVALMKREEEMLVIDFAEGFDRQALEELIAVERECCPFFTFGFDESSRRLEVGVREPEAAPALEAIADAFSATPTTFNATRRSQLKKGPS
jgi:hypothetical protein